MREQCWVVAAPSEHPVVSSVTFVFSLCLQGCDGANAALQAPAQEQFLGALTLAVVAHFSAGSDGGGTGYVL